MFGRVALKRDGVVDAMLVASGRTKGSDGKIERRGDEADERTF